MGRHTDLLSLLRLETAILVTQELGEVTERWEDKPRSWNQDYFDVSFCQLGFQSDKIVKSHPKWFELLSRLEVDPTTTKS